MEQAFGGSSLLRFSCLGRCLEPRKLFEACKFCKACLFDVAQLACLGGLGIRCCLWSTSVGGGFLCMVRHVH